MSKTSLSNPLPLLALRGGVLFPGTTVGIPVGRPRSLALLKKAKPGDLVVVGVQRDARVASPGLSDLQDVAVLARVERVAFKNERFAQAWLEGLGRVELLSEERSGEFPKVRVREVSVPPFDAEKLAGLRSDLITLIEDVGERLPDEAKSVLSRLRDEDDAGLLADRVAGSIGLEFEKEVHVLLRLDLEKRLALVIELLAAAETKRDIRSSIHDSVRQQVGKQQREHILREQMKAIQKELGDDDGDETERLKQRLDEKDLPEEVRKVAEREYRRLSSQQASGAEQGVIRNYLEWILDLPWTERAEAGDIDIDAVQAKLDADHAGLEEPKKRILEHLAVTKLAGADKATILALAGPPGVGKTSLGQSVADALGRPFVRIALGGVRDEAEVRGHRRTYVGSLPGRIVHGLKKAGVKNPVVLLDEVDKLGRGWAGDPEAALLEVLDPEQNHTFTDHYMELPFDLSEVLFLVTANELDKLSPPLRDRLEVIEMHGYTSAEKVDIARSHLIPKKLEDHGLESGLLEIEDEALEAIVAGYTREAGVRQLQRQITKLLRALALRFARNTDEKPAPWRVTLEELKEHLGKPRFFPEVAERTALPGVSTGLAWTPVGGDILFIETSRMKGKGSVEITGQLGDVMKESASAAMTYLRSHAKELGLDAEFLEGQDVHIHVPAGAVPKDGPSAGVTMFSALVSLFTGRKVRADTAMTGEVTLRGRVLPVGGIKSKVLAAHRAGIKRVVLPAKNERDVDDIPASVREQLDIRFANQMHEVLTAVLDDETPLLTEAGGGDTDVTALH
jgi:ATP-dependent Lon protease